MVLIKPLLLVHVLGLPTFFEDEWSPRSIPQKGLAWTGKLLRLLVDVRRAPHFLPATDFRFRLPSWWHGS